MKTSRIPWLAIGIVVVPLVLAVGYAGGSMLAFREADLFTEPRLEGMDKGAV